MDKLYNKAKNYAFNLLTYRPRSKKEVIDKLKNRKYSDEIIESLMEMLEEYNFINDEEFTVKWIQNRSEIKHFGRLRVRQELYTKGIEKSIVDKQLEIHLSDEKEYSLVKELIEKKKKMGKFDKKKFYNFLRRRGFSTNVINDLMSDYQWEDAETPVI